MINKFRNIANTEDKKILLSNFFSLSILQLANYILPLLTLPYLLRVLGIEYFGLLAFASAIVTYLIILTDYGFNLTATKEISINRDNKEKVVEVFSSVMTIKFILMLISFIFLFILVFSFNKFSKDWVVYFLTFGMVVGQILFPIWFFQGMEEMKYITYINVLAKSIFTVAIFIFVQEKNDFWIVPLLTSIGFIFAGILSLILVKKKFGISFAFQKIQTIKYYLIDGWHVFSAGMLTLIYTVSVPVLLGLFTNNTMVGQFSIAEKVIKTLTELYTPLSQAIFPFLSKKISINQSESKQLLIKLLKYSIIIMGFISLLVFIFSEYIVYILTGGIDSEIIFLIRLMSPIPLIITIARIFSMNYLISYGYTLVLQKIYFKSFLISLVLIFLLIPTYKAQGAVLFMLIIEVFVTGYMYYEIKRKIGFIK